MAFAPWNMLRSGRLRTDQEEQEREKNGVARRTGFLSAEWKRTNEEKAMVSVLEKIAGDVGAKDIRGGKYHQECIR